MRAELVVVSADEELGGGAAGGEEVVGVVAVVGVDGEAQTDEAFDAGVAAAGAQADVGAEGKTREEDGEAEAVVEPVEGCADVVDFAVAFVVCAFAEAGAAEVEAEDGETEVGEGFGRVVDGLGVHSAAAGWVWVGDEGGVERVFAAGVEDGFETAGGAAEVVDRLDVGAEGWGGGHVLSLARGVDVSGLSCGRWLSMRLN